MHEVIPYLISGFIGIGLAAATGFRIFLPFFVLSLATYLGWIPENDSWSWLGSQTTLLASGIAMICEVAAYYIPFIDNILDSIALPLATIAGTTIFASQLTDVSPFIQWSSAIIAGGGTAAAIGATFAGTRITSSATTAGAGNPVISTVETIGSSIMSIIAIFLPILAVLFVLILFYLVFRFGKKAYNTLFIKKVKEVI